MKKELAIRWDENMQIEIALPAEKTKTPEILGVLEFVKLALFERKVADEEI